MLTKRRCEGYPQAPATAPAAALDIIFNDAERRALLFFRTRTVFRILGYHDAGEWANTLLQYGYTRSPVKYAIVALASFHESLEPSNSPAVLGKSSRSSSGTAHDLALRYYNRVIHYLKETYYADAADPDTIMILCILLICLEQFRRGDAACVTHLVAGLRRLHWWRSSTRNYNALRCFSKQISDVINDKITPMLQRLRVQFALCMDQRHTSGELNSLPCFPKPNIPASYATIISARTDFDRSMTFVFTDIDKWPSQLQTASDSSSLNVLYAWKRALDTSHVPEGNVAEACAFKLLNIYYHTSLIITKTYNAKYEQVFDKFTDHFMKIVNLAQEILQAWAAETKEYRILFSFDLGLTPPMFLVASRCRHPAIRREAVAILLNSPDYRGAWHDRYSGLCAKRIVEIEEDGLLDIQEPSKIPEISRIRKVSADLQEDEKSIEMQYVTSPFLPDSSIRTTRISLLSSQALLSNA